ncbi:MAG: hypothetical protein WBE68_10260 [Candidatus Nitrosopolaris sp.]
MIYLGNGLFFTNYAYAAAASTNTTSNMTAAAASTNTTSNMTAGSRSGQKYDLNTGRTSKDAYYTI